MRGVQLVVVLLAVGCSGLWSVNRKTDAEVTVADHAPAFSVRDHRGRPVRSAELSARGPVALIFYRGHW